jgi:hypothetical protein
MMIDGGEYGFLEPVPPRRVLCRDNKELKATRRPVFVSVKMSEYARGRRRRAKTSMTMREEEEG